MPAVPGDDPARPRDGREDGNKPFALISVSVDEEKDTLSEFLTKEMMPWNHWWDGAQGLSRQEVPRERVPDALPDRRQGRDPQEMGRLAGQ